jgi:hypothetical protein
MTTKDYKPGTSFGFNLFGFAKLPRSGEWPPETCDNFVAHIIERFKRVYGEEPTHIDVPDDYTGKESLDNGQTINPGAKPPGHYYAYISQD